MTVFAGETGEIDAGLKSQKNETAVVYCELSMNKCQHSAADMATIVIIFNYFIADKQIFFVAPEERQCCRCRHLCFVPMQEVGSSHATASCSLSCFSGWENLEKGSSLFLKSGNDVYKTGY